MLKAFALLIVTFSAWPRLAAAGEIAGTVKVLSSFYAHETLEPRAARLRWAMPVTAQRAPSGVVVTLEGQPLAQKKSTAPPEVAKLTLVAGGFEPKIVACVVGDTLEIINEDERPLELATGSLVIEPIPGKSKLAVKLEKPGLFKVIDKRRPGVEASVVVSATTYLGTLDDTGDFAFEDLPDGDYTIRLFGPRDWTIERRVALSGQKRESVEIVLPPPAAPLNAPLGAPKAEEKKAGP